MSTSQIFTANKLKITLLTTQKNRHILALMKNVGIVIAAVIIILVVAVGGIFFLKSSKAPAMPKPTTTVTPTKALKTNSVILEQLWGFCRAEKLSPAQLPILTIKAPAQFYVADKKFAGDFNMKDAAGKATTAHIISDGTDIYIWSSAMNGGIKMSLAAAKSAATNAQNNQSVNINQNVSMNCGAWTVDASKFIVPTNITFSDMSKFFPQGQPTVTVAPETGAQTGTSPCDQIPAVRPRQPAKTPCNLPVNNL